MYQIVIKNCDIFIESTDKDILFTPRRIRYSKLELFGLSEQGI
jgi:hypothetical protein